MKNLAELARAVRRGVEAGGVECEKPFGFFCCFFFKGKRPILGNLKESYIVIVCLLVDFVGVDVFFKLTGIMIWCCGLFADWLERCVK